MTSKERSTEVFKFWLMITLATDHKPVEWDPKKTGHRVASDSDLQKSVEWSKRQK